MKRRVFTRGILPVIWSLVLLTCLSARVFASADGTASGTAAAQEAEPGSAAGSGSASRQTGTETKIKAEIHTEVETGAAPAEKQEMPAAGFWENLLRALSGLLGGERQEAPAAAPDPGSAEPSVTPTPIPTPTPTPTPAPTPTPVQEKAENVLTARSVTRNAAGEITSFRLNVTQTGDAKLRMRVNKPGIYVKDSGEVTLTARFAGKAVVTVTAPETARFKAAETTCTVTVYPAVTDVLALGNPSSGKLRVRWQKHLSGSGYVVECSNDPSFSENCRQLTVRDPEKTVCTFSGLEIGDTYYARVQTFRKDGGKNYTAAWGRSRSIALNVPPVTDVEAVGNPGSGELRVRWRKHLKGSGYVIQYSSDPTFSSDRAQVNIDDPERTVTTIGGLPNHVTYYVRIRTYRIADGKTYRAAWGRHKSITLTKLPVTKILALGNPQPGVLRIRWEKHTAGSGYLIEYAENSSFTKNAQRLRIWDEYQSACNVSGLRNDVRYYVRMRTVWTDGWTTEHSSWGNVRSRVLTKPFTPSPTHILGIGSPDYGEIRVRWKQRDSASGYEIQYAEDSGFTRNSHMDTIGDKYQTVHTKRDMKTGVRWHVRMRTYRVVGGKTYRSGWSAEKSIVLPSTLVVPVTDVQGVGNPASGELRIRWNHQDGVSGYIVQCSTNPEFEWDTRQVNVKDPLQTVYTFRGLKPDLTYYARIRSYKTYRDETFRADWGRKKSILLS